MFGCQEIEHKINLKNRVYFVAVFKESVISFFFKETFFLGHIMFEMLWGWQLLYLIGGEIVRPANSVKNRARLWLRSWIACGWSKSGHVLDFKKRSKLYFRRYLRSVRYNGSEFLLKAVFVFLVTLGWIIIKGFLM